jgi:alpha-galactosidase
VGLLALVLPALAQSSVRYLEDRKLWILDAERVSYVLGVNERGELQHVYWGKRLTRDADLSAVHSPGEWASFDLSTTTTPQEYPAWGAGLYTESCLKATLKDGNRDLLLHYVGHKITGNSLEIELKDTRYNIVADLTFQIEPGSGVLRKQATIRNRTDQPVVIESAQSGAWYLPRGDGYRLSYLTGRWAGEYQLQRDDIRPGEQVLESRRGSTSHQVNPWFAIDRGGKADEDHGDVWFGALGWSGSWKITVEQTPHQQVRVTGGYNTFDFGYELAPGQSLSTPPFYAGYTDGGFGEASRIFHRFQRSEILPGGLQSRLRPVLYNSWEATTFAVDEPGQKALAEKAAKIGVERFVMDDGWFGARNNDHAGLGDWFVNKTKFPNGLGGLISYVNGLGMDFGLWVEPEMVNPDSDLYRAHPDWAMHFNDRQRTTARNQLMLNLARDDVKEYVFGVLDKLVTENKIAFLKWDYNRNWSEPGWPEVAPSEQKKIWVRFVDNLYDIVDRLRAKHPGLEIESCSGGGGRIDLGILRRVDQVWTSDNTEAYDRLRIQEGFSYAYTTKVMMAWVTDVPNMNGRSTPLKYRFLVAMQGSLGIGSNLNKFSQEDFALSTKMVEFYKSIRRTVQEGKLYRLFSPREGDLTANQYVSEDGKQAVVFAFLHSQQYGRPAPLVYLKGLDPAATYRVRAIDEKLVGKPTRLSGSYLMNHGLDLRLVGDYDSTSIAFERE